MIFSHFLKIFEFEKTRNICFLQCKKNPPPHCSGDPPPIPETLYQLLLIPLFLRQIIVELRDYFHGLHRFGGGKNPHFDD